MAKINCKSRDEWLETRSKVITATEISSLFCLNPYMSAKKMIDRKLYPEFIDNIFMRLGKMLEPSVVKAIDLSLDLQFEYNIHAGLDFYIHKSLPLGATPDALGRTTLLECKSTSLKNFDEQWEAVPPYHHILQVHVQLMCVNKKLGYLACIPTNLAPEGLHDDLKLKVYFIHRHVEIEQMISDTVKRGYESYVNGTKFERRMKDNCKIKQLLGESVERIL